MYSFKFVQKLIPTGYICGTLYSALCCSQETNFRDSSVEYSSQGCSILCLCMRPASIHENETNGNVWQHSRIIIAAYSIEILLIKVTILLQYLRVLVPLKTRNLMFWASHTLIWLNVTFYSILFFLALFPCKPVKKYWNPWIEGRCIDDGKLSVFVASFNAASDILILILPQPLIWRLHMTLKRKIALSAVFLVGIW